MALKDSVLGVVLASSVVATSITIAYEALFLPLAAQKRLNQSEQDHALRFAQTVNTVTRGEGFQNAVSRQDFLLTVLLPLYESEEKYKPIILQLIALDAADTPPRNDVDAPQITDDDLQITSVDEVRTAPEIISALADRKAIPEEYSVSSIRDGFSSGYRRQFSDAIVREIDDGEAQLAARLIEALVLDPSEARSYRINLYVAYTLARVNAWTAPTDLVNSFRGLKNSQNYKDPTFRSRVDEALMKLQS